MPDYSLLDAEILVEIGRGNCTFAGLLATLENSAQSCVADAKTEAFRVIDRRLQALRKKGSIAYMCWTSAIRSRVDGKAVNRATLFQLCGERVDAGTSVRLCR